MDKIEAIFEYECRLTKDRPVIVGVSGGPDSLCLMEKLRQAGYHLIIAHFDHKLRSDSIADARVVEQTASKLMLPCVIDGADVRAYADENKLSIEEAGRTLRYRFMFDLARERDAQAVAVGHTADDQIETILMHFLRGSGLSGLKGMSYRSIINSFDPNIPIVRPLLDMWRDDTVVYCSVNGLRPHYDSSNDSINFQRNRIRHLLLPSLESYNPNLRETILRMSQSLKGDYTFMMDMLEHAWHESALEADDEMIIFDAGIVDGYSVGLQRNLIRHAMQTLRPGVDISYTVLERAARVVASKTESARGDLKGGLKIFREMDKIYIYTPDAELPLDLWPQLPDDSIIKIPVPGQIMLGGGWKLTCEYWSHPSLALEQAKTSSNQFQAWLNGENISDTLEIRSRRPGDHFTPLGMEGQSQKIADFFVNEKMPQRARDRWPLLCREDEILWVPGYRLAHDYRLTEETKKIIYLSLTHPDMT